MHYFAKYLAIWLDNILTEVNKHTKRIEQLQMKGQSEIVYLPKFVIIFDLLT